MSLSSLLAAFGFHVNPDFKKCHEPGSCNEVSVIWLKNIVRYTGDFVAKDYNGVPLYYVRKFSLLHLRLSSSFSRQLTRMPFSLGKQFKGHAKKVSKETSK